MSSMADKSPSRVVEMATAENIGMDSEWTDNGDGTYSINQTDGEWHGIYVDGLDPNKTYEVVTVFDGTGDFKWWDWNGQIAEGNTVKAVLRGIDAVRFGRYRTGDNLVGTLTKFSVKELIFDDFILGPELFSGFTSLDGFILNPDGSITSNDLVVKEPYQLGIYTEIGAPYLIEYSVENVIDGYFRVRAGNWGQVIKAAGKYRDVIYYDGSNASKILSAESVCTLKINSIRKIIG